MLILATSDLDMLTVYCIATPTSLSNMLPVPAAAVTICVPIFHAISWYWFAFEDFILAAQNALTQHFEQIWDMGADNR
jgi:hypothetical protein